MYKAQINNEEKEITIETDEASFLLEGNPLQWDISKIDEHSFHVIYQDKTFLFQVDTVNHQEKTFTFQVNGKLITVALKDKLDLLLEKLGMSDLANAAVNDVKAPMPGLILDILVKPGDTVNKGDSLMILEAMKMENVLKAPGDGEIKEITVSKGQSVEKNQILIQF